MNTEYIASCVNVMMTAVTVFVCFLAFFGMYVLAAWMVQITRNLIVNNPLNMPNPYTEPVEAVYQNGTPNINGRKPLHFPSE